MRWLMTHGPSPRASSIEATARPVREAWNTTRGHRPRADVAEPDRDQDGRQHRARVPDEVRERVRDRLPAGAEGIRIAFRPGPAPSSPQRLSRHRAPPSRESRSRPPRRRRPARSPTPPGAREASPGRPSRCRSAAGPTPPTRTGASRTPPPGGTAGGASGTQAPEQMACNTLRAALSTHGPQVDPHDQHRGGHVDGDPDRHGPGRGSARNSARVRGRRRPRVHAEQRPPPAAAAPRPGASAGPTRQSSRPSTALPAAWAT